MPDLPATPLFDDDALDALAEALIDLPAAPLDSLRALIADYRRLRDQRDAPAAVAMADDAQIVLDAAEWLRTLWEVGYMGGGSFPAAPKSTFPAVEVEDILKSVLLARIRDGRRPLPFPPPTRHGAPWHDVVETPGPFPVRAERVSDDDGRLLVVVIDGCAEWQVLAEDAAGLIIQHAGKGPHYRLTEAADESLLTRLPPALTVPIRGVERAGVVSYVLDWPRADGRVQAVPLRAASPARAEAAAQAWLASHHPERYGQVQFALPATP